MTPVMMNAPIVMQHPSDPHNWILVKDFLYTDNGVQEIIPQGFVFDFASVPKLFWNIISPIELGDAGPLKHDWAYRTKKGTRAKVDRQLLLDMTADGISWWKRNAAYYLVRACGWASWGKSPVVIEELIPCPDTSPLSLSLPSPAAQPSIAPSPEMAT